MDSMLFRAAPAIDVLALGFPITGGGVWTSFTVACSVGATHRLEATTGRDRSTNLFVRAGRRIEDDEMGVKAHCEHALRHGAYVLRTATDERKGCATESFAARGASVVNYFGRYTIEVLAAPTTG